MLKDYQKELSIPLEQCELEIYNLYKLFAEKFPSHRELWNGMLEEEINHATYLKKLSSLAEEGKISFAEKTEANQYTLVTVLSFSLNLEQSIIENKFYDYFSSSDRDAIMMINNIKEETLIHASKRKKSALISFSYFFYFNSINYYLLSPRPPPRPWSIPRAPLSPLMSP
jgi:hypothetical protein